MPLGVNSEEKGDYTDGDTLWGVNGLSLILGSSGWRDSGTNSRAMGSLDSVHE